VITGDMTAASNTLPTTPSSLVPLPFQLTPATVAPNRPPNSACDELDGRPSSQVSRFQMIPPTRPARMISRRASPPSAVSVSSGEPE
jgi:hypothetical protein